MATHHRTTALAPSSPPLPPLPSSASAFSPPSPPPKTKPQPIAITSSSLLEAPQQSPRRGSIATHLMNFASRSTTSLHILSSSAPAHTSSQDHEIRSQVLPLRSSGFSNPFRKLHSTFNGNKKGIDLGGERVVSSSASAHSMTSWRSKGAEMLSKKTWGRSRKNSEPLYGQGAALPPTPIFGSSLDDAVRMSHIQGTPMIPAVLHRCAVFLEAKGVDEVGLYRVPGSHANVQKLKKMFDSGKDHDLLKMDHIDPNDIATLLKLYLRELPTPLLPAFVLEQFQSLLSTDRHICHTLREILVRLPRPNYVVLSYLCHHLSRIAAHSEKTKMNVSNLGVVFAPTLSIGSVLFKALLGGFYDNTDSAESREKGLKIVWGGLLQDFEHGIEEYPEEPLDDPLRTDLDPSVDSRIHPGSLLFPPSLLQPSTAAQDIPSPLSLAPPPSGMVFSQSMPSDHQYTPLTMAAPTPAIVIAPGLEQESAETVSAEDEEAKLMAAMLIREELAVNHDDDTSSNASSNPCTDTTALSAVSSPGNQNKDQAFEASFTSPSMAFSPGTSSPATFSPSHLTSTANTTSGTFSFASTTPLCEPLAPLGALEYGVREPTSAIPIPMSKVDIPSLNITLHDGEAIVPTLGSELGSDQSAGEERDGPDESDESGEGEDLDTKALKRVSVAPQLPPLEGLMIAL